ncbi:MAG: NAD(+)/NADH kinase [Actinomycetota bacterium]|nr:NAD(+)/NADH kinase [Actinomycetota bacterium]
MKLGLVVHAERSQAHQVAHAVVAGARRRGLEAVGQRRDARLLGIGEADLRLPGIDLLVGVGGDGTMLEAVGLALQAGVPVLGVNVGRVGFLAEVEPHEVETALDALSAGEWNEVLRTTVQASWSGAEPVVGLNDVVIDKAFSSRLVSLVAEVDGRRFITYHADGVIVSTPTGSTAYNYSAGGPLVDPEVPVLVLTPVAPHSLFDRSVVFPPGTALRFRVEDRQAALAVDGQELAKLQPGMTVEVTSGPQPVRFISVFRRSFPQLVTGKLRLDRA